jgi:hypothetical protein
LGEKNESIASDYVFVSLKEDEKGIYRGVLPTPGKTAAIGSSGGGDSTTAQCNQPQV